MLTVTRIFSSHDWKSTVVAQHAQEPVRYGTEDDEFQLEVSSSNKTQFAKMDSAVMMQMTG